MRIVYIGRWIKGFKKFYEIGQQYNLSPDAQYRLTVITYYFNQGNKNASLTARYFGLHRNTVNNWLRIFDSNNFKSLEPKKPIPIEKIRKKTPPHIVQRVVEIKKKYFYFGKEKIRILLLREGIKISASTIGRIFKEYKLTYLWRRYESPVKYKKTIRNKKKRKRPPKIRKTSRPGQWIQIDTVVVYWKGERVYVISAIDLYSRIALSYAYKSPSSANAKDFLDKLKLFFPGYCKIEMIQSDNGSEFLKFFDQALNKEGIEHTFSYPKTPKMNTFIERYNRTIQEECLEKSDVKSSLKVLNHKIIQYIIEYNTIRPHQSLDYKTPLEVFCEYWVTSTKSTKEVHKKIWTHTF